MLIFEVENTSVDTEKLTALSKFLSGRADDTNSKKQISSGAFIKLARSLGVNITADNISDLLAQPPLSNVLEPYEPNSDIIKFKGNTDPSTTAIDVNQAEQIVNQNAKAAMRRGMNK